MKYSSLIDKIKIQISKQYKFFVDSFYVTLANFIKVVLGILLIPFFSRYIEPSALGSFDYLMAFTPFINQIISLGLTNSVSRFYLIDKDINYLGYVQRKLVINTLIVSFAICVVYFFFNNYFSLNGIRLVAFSAFLLNIFSENISFIPKLKFTLDKDFKSASLFEVISTVCRYLFTFGLIIIMKDKVLALLLGSLAGLLYITIQTHIIQGKAIYSNAHLSKTNISQIFSYSKPLLFLGFIGMVFSASDRILLQHITSSSMDVGYLGMGQRLGNIINLAIIGMLSVWSINALEEKSSEKFVSMQNSRINGLIALMVLSILVVILFKHFIIKSVFTIKYELSYVISILYIFSIIWQKIRETLEFKFLKNGNTLLITVLYSIITLFYVCLSYFLISHFRAKGVVLASTICSICHIGLLLYFNYKYHNKITIKYIVLGLLFTLAVIFLIF